MTADLKTRVELTCWNIIIPMMTKLRYIRSTAQPKQTSPLTCRLFITQVIIWSAAGLLIGFGISAIRALFSL
jgi:hypothetical protein